VRRGPRHGRAAAWHVPRRRRVVRDSTGRGEIVDPQAIVGGTAGFAGAGGALRASRTFDPALGAGTATVAGTVCLP